MPQASALLTFIAALFALEITPGPDMILVIARGIGRGRRIALLSVMVGLGVRLIITDNAPAPAVQIK
jgi:threonine/homoserine/homoserine lactone efflux protein